MTQTPDVDRLVRSMLELHGGHDDEGHPAGSGEGSWRRSSGSSPLVLGRSVVALFVVAWLVPAHAFAALADEALPAGRRLYRPFGRDLVARGRLEGRRGRDRARAGFARARRRRFFL